MNEVIAIKTMCVLPISILNYEVHAPP